MRTSFCLLLLIGASFALTDGLDLITRLVVCLSPLILLGLLRLTWSMRQQTLPEEAYSLLTDHPMPVPPPRREGPSTGSAAGDLLAGAVSYRLGESMFR